METNSGRTETVPNRGWHFVRIAVALVLFVAAATKCHQCCTGPIPGNGLFSAKWFVISLVEAEWLGSVVLLLCLLPKPAWAMSLVCFSAFALVSLGKGMMGEASCGCFGRWQVNPFVTAAIDLGIVCSLLFWRPSKHSIANIRQMIARATCVLVIWLSIGLPAGYTMASYRPAILSEAGKVVGAGQLVLLAPERWVGKQFPLLSYIEDVPGTRGERPFREQLAEGDWLVVLYHHNCPKCQEQLPKYSDLAARTALDPTAPHLALIEIPPYGDLDALLPTANAGMCSFGRLSGEKRWLVETPVDLQLRSARVLSVNGSETRNDYSDKR